MNNPNKTEDDLFHHHHFRHHNHHDDMAPPHPINQSHPSTTTDIDDDDPLFPPLPEIDLFRSSSASSSPAHSSSETDDAPNNPNPNPNPNPNHNLTFPAPTVGNLYVSPEPHISNQFYTFNMASHALMIRCLIESRLATATEIRDATPADVLKSWRAVWKDRNEDTAYITAWKRIQDKLSAHLDPNGNEFLCFKNNTSQFVSHICQWQDIVMAFHSDTDMRHLGLKDTVDRIKQVWTVGAKFYGIPESYIRVCISACPECSAPSSSSLLGRNKRRRFEYTESFDVPAKEVPQKLQQLAAEHKVVLCIRQKYIRYKPFMAEVKDYACHRAGEPTVKKTKIFKREPYSSKRCGCGFRIRAIVPITNYNEKDKTFVYQEEGVAVFKLYAVHSGHEPGPLDGNARIMHRVVGYKGGFLMDQDTVYGVSDEFENEGFGLLRKDERDMQHVVLQQVKELRAEVGSLEEKIAKISHEQLGTVSQELSDILNKVRHIGEGSLKPNGLRQDKPESDDILVGENDLAHWTDHHDRLYGDGQDTDLIEDDEDSFGRTLGDVAPWEQMRTECRSEKNLICEPGKPGKWLLKCSDFDEKSILDCQDTKLTKPLSQDESIVTDVSLIGLQVDSFYQGNSKWYDSPCGLDPGADCGDSAFRDGGIV